MLRNRLEEIKSLRERGKKLREIGDIFKCSGERIRQLLLCENDTYKIYKCEICNIDVKAYRVRNRCSNHSGKYKRIFNNCIICTKPLLSKKNRKYCNKHNILMEGKDFLREKVRVRDKHTCQMCGKIWIEGTRRFDVHHLDEEAEGWDNRKTNKNKGSGKSGIYQNDKKNFDRMITYCHKCHLNLDSVRNKMSLRGRKK